MSDSLFDDLNKETGVVFGFTGVNYLGEAIARARGLQTPPRRVIVLSAANLATVTDFKDNILGAIKITGSAQLLEVIEKVRKLTGEKAPQAIVFNGLGVYAQLILQEVCGLDNPVQADWQRMGRQVANDLRAISEICSVLYVSCDVVMDDSKPPVARLNINPGSTKLILEDLVQKVFVCRVRGADGYETVVQTDADLALKFKAPRGSKEEAASADGSGSTDAAPKKRVGLRRKK